MKKIVLTILTFLSVSIFANVNYNVFIKMDDNAEKNVQNISKSLKENKINSLFSKGYIVHLTLYLTEYDAKSLDEIKKVVDDIAENTKPFELDFYKIRKTGGNWLMLDARNNTQIQALADEVTFRLNELRAKDALVPNWAKSIPAKVRSFEHYGSPNVFSSFDPHITLLTPENVENITNFLNYYEFKPFKTKVTAIGIAEVDSLGQAKEAIYLKEIK